ncbi:internal virion protein [Ralstonia phage RSB3]|uniref:Putative internal virion protein n=1 Tax=Ralstonia phage RSB3 TaxID=1402875 RepID=U3TIZ3_9CAUD|nr:internal virion protein [Ralstonia phage RSB3]BAN92351.1 putative internal virion protein [Ralstonia phage RSB3]
MSWGFVGAAAVVVVGSMISSKSQKDANNSVAKNSNNSNYLNYTNAVKQTMENNEAIGEANTTNMIRAGYKAGILQLQTARLKEQAAQEGYLVSKSADEALANVESNAAASGTVGNTVNTVAQDVKKKSDEAQIAVDINWYHTLENQNDELAQLVQESQDAQQSVQHVPDISSVGTVTAAPVNALGNAAGAVLSMYASSKMSLGNGKTTTPSSGGTNGGYSYGSVLNGVSGSYRLTN